MSQSSELIADLDAVGDIIARAEADMAAGVDLDFAPLESQIEELCTRIEGLPPSEGRAMQSRLLALADTFGRLTQSIETALSEVKAEMGGVSGRQRAANAYAKSSKPK
jgi:HAMP domain-containing protein